MKPTDAFSERRLSFEAEPRLTRGEALAEEIGRSEDAK